ncbi:baseplate J/gp47 family protein [Natrialba phage PhiCh1]|uniref:Baseplate J family protein n=2 Tax=root TaxID=1 RepID=D3T2H7_NATMM|nr:baseplate J/gp47 family protein [Natrialba magadii]NP_665948.1 baseplate J/gp47 family protein [Natrialba phage PhiCh1]YP_010078058.1 baseplate J/gp47 family protein [Natrialba phage PhiCh1]AAM88704.1 unknown [Natrialba phage PhiCh1]ADD07786.1 virus protein phiCh1-VP30 [Natrialba magadii ATCC 43099]ELY23033.1 baseplate J family protein [Natrialba magadii ATCC 43099]QBJ01209.1 baseplate J family protein [Natrialba phage PhiCh1]
MSENSDYGVQDDGTFRRKHVDVIRDDAERRFKNTAGEDIEFNPSSGQQAIIDILTQEAAVQWMALEEVYYAGFFEDASGEALDKQLALAGFSRQPSQSATGEVVFKRDDPADDDITIDEETEVTTRRSDTRPAIPFETTEEVILQEGQTEVTASIEARKAWQVDLDEEWLGEETNIPAGEITEFGDPVAGVDDVENELPTGDEDEGFQPGRDRESDAEFRLRYQNSLAEGGTSTAPAMESSVYNYDEDIIDVRIDEVRDEDEGFGPRVTVFAPEIEDDDIAQAILEARGAGTESIGEESGTAEFDAGDESTEHFDRAEEITIYVDAELTTSDSFSDDDIDTITDRIIQYIGGEAGDDIVYPGLEIGDEVIYDQIFRRVMETSGVIEADLEVGTDEEDLDTENIDIDDREAAMTGLDEVSIDES